MTLASYMQSLPQAIQMNIMDNVINMNSVTANVHRGANIVSTRVYAHCAINGCIAWKKQSTNVSVNDILCTMDSIKALHISQVHAIKHCMDLLQEFMLVFSKTPDFIYSLLYGEMASFIVTFGLYQDLAITRSKMNQSLPTASPTDVVEIFEDTVDNAMLDGKFDIPNFYSNLFKSQTILKFPVPAAKRYAKTAAAILYAMRTSVHDKQDFVMVKCGQMAIALPSWVLKDKPGKGKRPLVSHSMCLSVTDMVYSWLQDVYVACEKNCVSYTDHVKLFNSNKMAEFKMLHDRGTELMTKLKESRAPGAPKKKRRYGDRDALIDVSTAHKF
jgi:hypothetical protein